MVEVKGVAVISLPLFIKEKFGETNYKKWIEALSPEAREAFSSGILASSWYPIDMIFIQPTLRACELFYNNNLRGAWDAGRFSADYSLKGIYKVFVRIGSVESLVKKASTIMPTYYRPSSMEVGLSAKGSASLRITEFQNFDKIVEFRVGGWMERALEISGAKDIKVDVAQSLTKGDPCTEYKISWV
jgi:hypothetical protein